MEHQSTIVINYNIIKSGGPPDFFFNTRGEVENRQVEPRGGGGEEEEDLFFLKQEVEYLASSIKSESESYHLHQKLWEFSYL